MLNRRNFITSTAVAALCLAVPANAQDSKIPVVATFSILGDFVREVGGDRIDLSLLVGPGSDAHVYAPAPGDAKKLAAAKLVVQNGLGFEGWIGRLIKASNTKARELLGWQPQYGGRDGFMRGLTETIAWFREPTHLSAYKADIYNL